METQKTFFNTQKAAVYLRVSEKTLRRWGIRGILVPVRTSGGHRRYTLSQLNDFKKNKKNLIKSTRQSPVQFQRDKNHISKELNTIASVLELNTPIQKASDANSEPINRIFNDKGGIGYAKFLLGLILFVGISYFITISFSFTSSFIGNNTSKYLSSMFSNLQEKEFSPFPSVLAATSFNNLLFKVNIQSQFEENVAFNGEDITSTSQTVNIFNENVENISLGSEGGKTTINTSLSVIGGTNDIAGTLNLSGNTLTASGDLTIDPSGGGTKIGNGTPNSIDQAGGDLFVTGDLEVDGTSYIPTLAINGDTFTDLTGTGLQVSNNVLEATLGTSVSGSEIEDRSIKEIKLSVTNTASSGNFLTYDSASGGFTWVSAGSITGPWTDSGTTTYLTDTTDELVLGGTTPLSSAKFSLDGDTDQIQALIQGNATQTTNIFEIENSAGTNLLTVDNSGNVTLASGADVTIGAIGLNDLGTSNTDSGASLVGVFDEFANSNGTTVQDVLDDLDSAISGGGSKWTDSGSLTYLTSTTDSITIGSAIELGKLAVDGDADEIQFLVQGNATQNAFLGVFEQSDGTDVLTIANNGNLTSANIISAQGTSIGLNNDASANNVIGFGTGPGAATGDLYWGDKLLCTAASTNCGWVAGTGTSPFTSTGGIIDKTTASDRLRLLYGDAGDTQLEIQNTTNSVVPTADAMQLNLSGGAGITTDNVDGLYVNIEGADGTSTDLSAIHIDFDPITGSSDDTFNGLLVDGITGTAAIENAINIGTGWDTGLTTEGGTAGTAFVELGSDQTNNTILEIGAPSAVTVSGSATPLRGLVLDLSTNYTFSDDSVTGATITLGADTDISSTIDHLRGIDISGGTVTVNGVSARPEWEGVKVTIPDANTIEGIRYLGYGANILSTTDTQSTEVETSIFGVNVGNGSGTTITNTNANGAYAWTGFQSLIPTTVGTDGFVTTKGAYIELAGLTQTAGTAVEYGLDISMTGADIITGGTVYGINITGRSNETVGTIYGTNISDITAGTATEHALYIGSGWDSNLFFNDTTTQIQIADGGTFTFEDSAGNDLITMADSGTTGNLVVTGNSTVNGNTTIGNANTDTFAINAGVSGTGITLTDTTFANCTLTTISNVLTCGAGGGAVAFTTSGGIIDKTTASDRLRLLYGDAGDVQLEIQNTTNSVVPTADAMQINLGGGSGITTAGVDGLYINIEGANGANTLLSALHLDFDPITGAGDDNFYGILLDAITPTAASEIAFNIGNGWDTELVFEGTTPTIQIGEDQTLFIQNSAASTLFSLLDNSGTGNGTFTGDLTVSGGDITGVTGESIDLGEAAADTLTFTTGGATELTLSGTNLNPGAAEGNSLGSATNEWEQLFLGDNNGIAFGLDQDWTLGYDEATDDRLEFVTAGTSGMLVSSAVATGTGLLTTFDSVTTGTAVNISADGLTSGTGLLVDSTSTSTTAITTGKLGYFNWSPGSATTTTGDLFRLNIGANGNVTNIFNVTDAGTSLFSVGETQITSALPHQFTAAGDVSIAYDLQFSNQTSSYIKSNAPLYLEAGESFESNDLTLRTYNSGNIILDTGATAGKVSIGSGIAPIGLLTVDNTNTGAIGKALAMFNQDETQAVLTASASGTTIMTMYGGSGGDLIVGSDGVNTGANIGGNGVLVYGAVCVDDTLDTADDCIDTARAAGSVSATTAFIATVDDIAENFPTSDNSIEALDIVGLDYYEIPSGADTDIYETEFVKKSAKNDAQNVLGVISAKPGVLLGGFGKKNDPRSVQEVAVALSGRIPVKVTSENGNIEPGDLITVSDIPGVGMKSNNSSDVIVGKALARYHNSNTQVVGEVLIFVNTVWRGTEVALNENGDLDEIKTALIKPQDDRKDIAIQVGNNNLSGFGALLIQNSDGQTVAAVDEEGNAEFSGQLSADSLQTEEASISGELVANTIKADHIISPDLMTRDEIEALLDDAQSNQDLMNDSQNWDTNASGSASLNELALENLFVTGTAAFDTASIARSATFGNDLVISSRHSELDSESALSDINSIDTLNAPLSIQSSGSQPLYLMAGLVQIDTDGNVSISGNLQVTGRIDSSAAEFKSIQTEVLAVTNDPTATESATLSGIAFTSNSSAGNAKVGKGTNEVTLINSKIKKESLVFTTATSQTNSPIFIKSQIDGKVVIGIKDITEVDITFNWWIVGVSD